MSNESTAGQGDRNGYYGDFYSFAFARSSKMTLIEICFLQRQIEVFISITESNVWRGELENGYLSFAKDKLALVIKHRIAAEECERVATKTDCAMINAVARARRNATCMRRRAGDSR